MCRIKILNKHHGHKPDGQRKIYIGRGSPLGSPFKIGVYGNRDTCIQAYKSWLQDRIAENHYDVCAALSDIAHKALTGGVDLICYCTPQPCHGDIIKAYIIERLNKGDH